jgi:hypothetical protein
MKFKDLYKLKKGTKYHYVAELSMSYSTLILDSEKSNALRDLIDSDICNLDYELFLDELDAIEMLKERISNALRVLEVREKELKTTTHPTARQP